MNHPPLVSDDTFSLDRRGFLRWSARFGLGVVLAPHAGLAATLDDTPWGNASPHLWVRIDADGDVHIVSHRAEMGQQIWTAVAQVVADEMEADWSRVQIVQALGDPVYGDQNTDGSRSIRYNLQRLRVAGAACRYMLERAAAMRAQLPVTQCKARNGTVICADGAQTFSFGELAADFAGQTPPALEDISLKPRSQWRYIGHAQASVITPDVTHGKARYGIDQHIDGMVHAVVARPPDVFGKTGTVDDSAALAVPGVLQTVRLPDLEPPAGFKPHGGVAVVARDTWAAMQGRGKLDITWQPGPNKSLDSRQYSDALLKAVRSPGTERFSRGDVAAAFKNSASTLIADYSTQHLAHASMEPPAALAYWDKGKLTCHACVQDGQTTRKVLAGFFDLPPSDITVHTTWLGGAFGRKSKPDFVIEAAFIARAVGKPVKVTWTREDDLQHGYYLACNAQHLEAALDGAGNCTAMRQRTAFPSIGATFAPQTVEARDSELSQGVYDNPIAPASFAVETGRAPAHLRIGWLRSVCNTFHAFAGQSFAAELAHAAGRDAKDYLLQLIGPDRIVDPVADGAKYTNYGADPKDYPFDTARLRHVVEVVAEKSGWGRSLPAGSGLGIATHRAFLTYVATVIEVAVDDDGRLTIPAVWTVADAGTVVNTGHTRDQIGGGVVFGLSNALFGEITASGGQVNQRNFPDWRLMRMSESPLSVDVTLVDSDAPPAGAGEPGTPTAAPALANAIFAATGRRIRRLPMIGSSGDRLFD